MMKVYNVVGRGTTGLRLMVRNTFGMTNEQKAGGYGQRDREPARGEVGERQLVTRLYRASCSRKRSWIFLKREIETMGQLSTWEIISVGQERNGKMKREMVVAQIGAITVGNEEKRFYQQNVLDIDSRGFADALLMEDYIR